MKKALNIFLVVLGIIFLCLLLILGGLFLFGGSDVAEQETDGGGVELSGPEVDSNPMLNESQETMLETVGIDPASLPTEVTAEQEACFEAAIGADRVNEIAAGDTPTAGEIFKGRGCL